MQKTSIKDIWCYLEFSTKIGLGAFLLFLLDIIASIVFKDWLCNFYPLETVISVAVVLGFTSMLLICESVIGIAAALIWTLVKDIKLSYKVHKLSRMR